MVVNNGMERTDGGTWHMADSFLSMKARKMAPRPRKENPRPSLLFLNHKCCVARSIIGQTVWLTWQAFATFPIKENDDSFPDRLQTRL